MLCYAMLCYALTLCYAMLCVVRSVNFHVFWQFLWFSLFSNHFLAILGHFWVPWASFFDVFLNTDFAMFFLDHFCTNFKKGGNMKSAQNTAPVHRFKGSPVWKKHAQLWKNALFFSLIFHWKSIENQARKLEKLFPRQKLIKHRFLAPLLVPRIVF